MLRFRSLSSSTIEKQLNLLSNRHFHIFLSTNIQCKHYNMFTNLKPNKYILSCKFHSNNVNNSNNTVNGKFSSSFNRFKVWFNEYLNPINESNNVNNPSMTSTIANSSSPYVVSTESQNKTIRLAFLANTTICISKLIIYLITNSSAMFSEFIHTFVDTVNQGVLIIGAKQATRQPDYKFQSGYGKTPFFWSLISAMNVFWVGFIFPIYHTILYPSISLDNHWYTYAVLGLSLLLDGAVLRISLLELKKLNQKICLCLIILNI